MPRPGLEPGTPWSVVRDANRLRVCTQIKFSFDHAHFCLDHMKRPLKIVEERTVTSLHERLRTDKVFTKDQCF